ncbi:MAG: flagellar basal body P-ring formation protein FlgA [Planctomycetes bacterium]|nr:flagellar basal body P-ring formation protein FlgA [Planctomycetota bacterium]MCB9905079.1 flagellar basal body P-ring formation protein FlgA [Planctomycetota bacterium]
MMTTLAALLLSTGITVTLPEQTTVSGTDMKLGDIALVRSDDEALAEQVRGLNLGYAPAPGYNRTLRQWKLQQDVEAAFPGTEVVFTGASVMRVFPKTATILAGEIEVAARKAVAELLEGEEYRASLRGALKDLQVPLGDKSRRLEVDLKSRRREAGAWSVPIRVMIDDVQYSTVWVSMQVDIFRELPVLKRDVRMGEEIGPDDYSIERVLIDTALTKTPVNGAPEYGALAATNLVAGNVLFENDLKYALFVEKDAIAKLNARNGSVEVNVMVIVLEDGRLGDHVRVRSLSGDKEVTARVTGKGSLEFNLKVDGPVTHRKVNS